MAKIFLTGLLLFTLSGCSPKYGIHKSYAFTRKTTAGNIPVDQNNQPLSTGVQQTHFIYIETPNDIVKPVWDTAWVNGAAYFIEPFKIIANEVQLGKVKDGEEEISFTAEPGHALWQLMLKPVTLTAPAQQEMEQTLPAMVLLSGIWKGKKVTYRIKEETELATVFGQ